MRGAGRPGCLMRSDLTRPTQILLSKDVACIAVNRSPNSSPHDPPYHGLFDVRDPSRAHLAPSSCSHSMSSSQT